LNASNQLCATISSRLRLKVPSHKISSDITQIDKTIKENTAQTAKVKERVDKLKEQRDLRRTKRHDIEGDWRKLSGEGLEQGGQRFLRLIGELKSKLTELATKISSEATLKFQAC
jgi:chromosome segregation ATPase